MTDLIAITYGDENATVSGRELHERLGIETPYKKWFDRMTEYGFDEEKDYISMYLGEDHAMTIDMAKTVSIISGCEKGKEIYRYLKNAEEQNAIRYAVEVADRRLNDAMKEIHDKYSEKKVVIDHPTKKLYVICSDVGKVKIGISDEPESRIKMLEKQGGFTAIDVYITPPAHNARHIELNLHKRYKDFRCNGEWFDLLFEDARQSAISCFSEMADIEPRTRIDEGIAPLINLLHGEDGDKA